MSNELKPCKKCEGVGRYWLYDTGSNFFRFEYRIECEKCGHLEYDWNKKSNAISAWNKRAGE